MKPFGANEVKEIDLTSKRAQALLNEYKGNLYEFLVGKELARIYKVEDQFYQSLLPSFVRMLSLQQVFLKKYYPHLLVDLPSLAQNLAKKIQAEVLFDVEKVLLVGKSNRMGHEGDLVLLGQKGQIQYVGIKLSKAKAFVNTKSAGVKSFLKKYFSTAGQHYQEEFNQFFDQSYTQLCFDLFDQNGLNFEGSFEEWKRLGLSELPGELPQELRSIYLDFQHRVASKLAEFVEKILELESPLSLLPLLGHGDSRLLNAKTYYTVKNHHYCQDKHVVDSTYTLEQEVAKGFSFVPSGKSHFELRFKNKTLQMRIKAMNKFSTGGFKINCSVKDRD